MTMAINIDQRRGQQSLRAWHGPTVARLAVALVLGHAAAGEASQVKTSFVQLDRSGALVYTVDERGNRVPDFSNAGYQGGGVPFPEVPARVRVDPAEGDDGARIQAAIDHVAGLPADAQGLRGAVVLAPGQYEIAGYLRINASGIVLRGAGDGPAGTLLLATGTDRRALLQVRGVESPVLEGPTVPIRDAYLPVGTAIANVASGHGFRAGDRIRIEWPSPPEWIKAVGMDDAPAREPFSWKAGRMNRTAERTIVQAGATELRFDAPLPEAVNARLGGATVQKIRHPGRISEVGLEHLRCQSAISTANPKDEDHAWMAISVDHAENGWISHVTATHFVSSAVQLGSGTRAITVQDCSSLSPVSELAGYRRHSFHTRGELTLFNRCHAEQGLHDFTVGYLVSGPNVFLDCTTTSSLGWSGSIGSWSTGILFDNVRIDGAGLQLDNLEVWNQGVGWSAANSVLWQSSAAQVKVRRPPTADNWAIGVWGEFYGNGWWDQVNEFVRPLSLYRAQLAARKGQDAAKVLDRIRSTPLPPPADVPTMEQLGVTVRSAPPSSTAPAKALALRNGWLVSGAELLAGKPLAEMQWWRGTVLPTRAEEYGPSLTRFAPGLTGTGLTDDLDEMTDAMVQQNAVVLRHHYGLWYDRRRMDHQRVRRADADVWPPFFEQPFARSGQGEAWDRLSRYDLTRYNPWYFGRLREFATLAQEKGLVLINEMYFQHNILEAGAHWADFPWRSANNINETGFPEPPPYTDNEGNPQPHPDLGKRIFMAEAFYDSSHPARAALHRAYIRQCLASLAGQPNVIHTLTAENSGPLHFMEFWLDVVAEWERETGHRPLLALSAAKDVQDAILADPSRAALIDVIDLTYWWQLDNGALYAPAGGTRLAPRQHERQWRHGRPSATALAAMVRDYRARFPEKAVITGLDQKDGWTFVAAGGSLPRLPATTDKALLNALPTMRPAAAARLDGARGWVLEMDGGQQFLWHDKAVEPVRLVAPAWAGRTVELRLIEPTTGKVQTSQTAHFDATGSLSLSPPPAGPAVWWIVRGP